MLVNEMALDSISKVMNFCAEKLWQRFYSEKHRSNLERRQEERCNAVCHLMA